MDSTSTLLLLIMAGLSIGAVALPADILARSRVDGAG
jgi:hypothetical protein